MTTYTKEEADETLTRMYLQRLANDRLAAHRKQAAAREDIPLQNLIILTYDSNREVRRTAMKNPAYLAFREDIATQLRIDDELPVPWREQLIDAELRERYPSLHGTGM